jgi:hypothetical protein
MNSKRLFCRRQTILPRMCRFSRSCFLIHLRCADQFFACLLFFLLAYSATAAAMGGGDEKVFEKKLSKEEKKALAKAKREAKKSVRKSGGESGDDDQDDDDDDAEKKLAQARKMAAQVIEGGEVDLGNATLPSANDGIDHVAADALAAAGTICTFATSRKGVDARNRDINGKFPMLGVVLASLWLCYYCRFGIVSDLSPFVRPA